MQAMLFELTFRWIVRVLFKSLWALQKFDNTIVANVLAFDDSRPTLIT